MTFESLIPGPCNRQALEAALLAASNPGGDLLYIFGPAGTGKTHLLRAVEDHIRRTRPELSVICIPSEVFLAELIQAIRHDRREEFDSRYHSARVLLLDDLQFIADKETTFRTFREICREIQTRGGQVVVTADQPPTDDFFARGTVVRLEFPDLETRRKILAALSEEMDLPLEPEVTALLAESFPGSVRQLTGAFKRLRAYRDLMDLPPTLENTVRILADIQK